MVSCRHTCMYSMYNYGGLQDANFTTSVELAVRFGKTLLIQEMDTVEPILFPLLRGDLIR